MKIVSIMLALPLLASAADTPGRITMRRADSGNWELFRDGKPFTFRGAGGGSHLDVLAASGGNSIRTWGIDALGATNKGKPLVDEARERGLSIAAGIWVGHERHGFNYSDPAQLEKQRQQVRAAVAKW